MVIFRAGIGLILATNVVAAQGSRTAPPPDRIPIDRAVTVGKLANGLRYYIRKNTRPEKRAELRLVVNVGSILEDPNQLGLAHFVEHMAFNGTTNFKKQALVDYIEGIGMRFGADLNASTSFDETIYQLVVPTDSAHLLAKGLQILEEWAHRIAFDTTEIRKERGVVIEEWRLGQGAQSRMLRKQFPVLFHGSRYADRLPIGTKESLETFAPAALKAFYRDWYRPDLMAVIAVGDFDPAVVEQTIRARFGKLVNPARSRPRPQYSVPSRDSTRVAIATDPEASGTSISVYYLRGSRPLGTVSAYRRQLVGQLYGQMLNQRLFELTQKANPPFIGAGGGTGSLVRNIDVFNLGASVADTGALRGMEAVLTEVHRVERHGFTATELDRASQEFVRGYEQAFAEREKTESANFVEEYIQHFLTAAPSPGIAYEFGMVKRIVPTILLSEVNNAAQSWLQLKDRVLLLNAPEKPTAKIPSAADLLTVFDQVKQTDVAAYQDSVSSAPLVALPLSPKPVAAERFDSALGVTYLTLENGASVILKPTTFKADEVLLSAFSPGGNSVEPDSLFRASVFATQLVGIGGLADFPLVELQKKLAGKAISLFPYIGSFQEGVRGQASPKDLETLFQLLYLNFTAPRRDPEAVQAFKDNVKAAIANRGSSPAVAFRDTLSVTMAQHHPRSQPITSAMIDSMDVDKSLVVYRDRFGDASDFTFVVVGSFTVDGIKPLIARYLANLPATRRAETWKDPGIRTPRGVVELEVHRGIEPKSQTELVFSGPFPFSRGERFVLRSVADILEIKLREQLREELGGTYSVSVSASPTKIPREEYTVSISFGSAPDRVNQLLKAVFAEIDSLATSGPGEKEIAKVKEALIRARETDLKENGYWLGQLAQIEQTGDDPKTILDGTDLLALLTADRLKAAAARYLDRSNVVRVTLLPEGKPATP